VLDRLVRALGLHGVLGGLSRRVCALTVVPDDALHGFPFAAVRRSDRYLVQDYALTLAFSPLAGRRGGAAPVVGSALLAGVADAPAGVDRLEQVPRELDAVGAWAAGHGVRIERMDEQAGRPARREALLGSIPTAALVHVACHGIFEPNRPDRSGLVLFPEPGVTETLTLRDLSTRQLGAVSHVTLSSCWSADSYVLPGRWIISLPETLCRAGAGSVLGSLWPVAENFARAFQPAFYRALDTLPRDRAVQRAQVAAIEATLIEGEAWTADPVFWSGLTLYGDPSRLPFPRRAPSATSSTRGEPPCTVSP
jgi:CHAT domain-containing protein